MKHHIHVSNQARDVWDQVNPYDLAMELSVQMKPNVLTDQGKSLYRLLAKNKVFWDNVNPYDLAMVLRDPMKPRVLSDQGKPSHF